MDGLTPVEQRAPGDRVPLPKPSIDSALCAATNSRSGSGGSLSITRSLPAFTALMKLPLGRQVIPKPDSASLANAIIPLHAMMCLGLTAFSRISRDTICWRPEPGGCIKS